MGRSDEFEAGQAKPSRKVSIDRVGALGARDFPGYTVETMPFAPRTPEHYEALKADIARHGIKEPLIVFGDELREGHHRYQIAKELGIRRLPITGPLYRRR